MNFSGYPIYEDKDLPVGTIYFMPQSPVDEFGQPMLTEYEFPCFITSPEDMDKLRAITS